VDRPSYLNLIEGRLDQFSAVALLGPRQVGKTYLARELCGRIEGFDARTNYFDLEDPVALGRLSDPKLALHDLAGVVVIDEVQRTPELFPVLRYLLDRPDNRMKLLLLGSASRDLIQQSSESLAGRIAHIEVAPFGLFEAKDERRLWLRGGFPLAYLADDDVRAFRWLDELTRTYLERDIPSLGLRIPPVALRRLWVMLAHNHGQILNLSDLGRSLGASDTTVRRYIDVLAGTFMIRLLPAWWQNIKKRQVKRPKLFFRDTGLLHQLLGIRCHADLDVHPRLGASWEGFALEEVLRRNMVHETEAFFWAVHSQAELDLLVVRDGKRHGFEFKYASAPRTTRSMRQAITTLELDTMTIVAPSAHAYRLAEDTMVCPPGQCVIGEQPS
jgi:predicted AAA+ superfamily ATPase